MITALGVLVSCEALELQFAPAEPLADRSGHDKRSLDPTQRQGDVRQGEQPPTAPKSCSGAVQTEAEVAKKGSHDPGEKPGCDEHQQTGGEGCVSVGRRIAGEGVVVESDLPELPLEGIKAEQVPEGLRRTEQAREDGQAEVEHACRQHAFQAHREEGPARFLCIFARQVSPATRSNMLAQ